MGGLAQWVVLAIGLWIVQTVNGRGGEVGDCNDLKELKVPAKNEKCKDYHIPVANLGQQERGAIVDIANHYRALFTKECGPFKSGKPKAANLRKLQYSCEYELSVAEYACPEKQEDWKSDGYTFRYLTVRDPERKPPFWHAVPWLDQITITNDAITDKRSSFFYFVTNSDATEIGCANKVCTFGDKTHDLVACTTGVNFPLSGPLPLTGKGCEKDADCKVPGYGKCDTKLRLCEHTELKCKVDVPGSTLQPCKLMAECSEKFDKRPNLICKSTVLIAVKNSDDSFTVKAMGVAVSPKHFLTSVTSNFQKFGNEELYIILKGKNALPLRNEFLLPRYFLGPPDFKTWSDFVLVELAEKSPVILQPMEIDSKTGRLPGNGVTFISDNQGSLDVHQDFNFLANAECANLFDDVIKIDSKYAACSSDVNSKHTEFLTGAPVTIKVHMQDRYMLFGLRSVTPISVPNSEKFLVTLLAPHCPWFETVTNGAVKCIDLPRTG